MRLLYRWSHFYFLPAVSVYNDCKKGKKFVIIIKILNDQDIRKGIVPMKIAIVTGASSGLGSEFVRQIRKQEKLDEIWVVARRKDRLTALEKELQTHLRIITGDLTKAETLHEIEAMLWKEKPNVRILVNAAGYGKIGSWRDIKRVDVDGMIDLNCKAAVAMTQISLPFMKRGARILQICSTAAFQPFQYLSVYAATKAFLYRYSRALRVELYGTGIRVTAVCPYWIKDTEFIGRAKKSSDSSYIHSFPLASRQKNVARHALLDAKLGLAVSTPGIVCTLHRAAAKIVPADLMMGAWALIRRI